MEIYDQIMGAETTTIIDQIRSDIVNGAFEQGARLRIEDLAGRYGVSPMPVREALNRLHGEGLVVIAPNRGARVRQIDARFVENLFDIRAALEAMLALRSAERRTLADIEALKAEQEKFEDFVAAKDYPEVLQSNKRFHQIVNEAGANEEAYALSNKHWVLIATLWQRFGYQEERFAGVISDHRELIAALEARDGPAAAAIMQAHVIKSKLKMLQVLKKWENMQP